MNVLEKLESARPFTQAEAWSLFRLAAIGEAVGWSLLITGILIERYLTPGSNIPVLLVGQVHGVLFLIYILAVAILYGSLGWSRKLTLVAAAASVPPYGSLLFEQWAAYLRRREALKNYREIVVRAIIVQNQSLLAIQPRDSAYWILPGGSALAKETAEQALVRLLVEQTGIKPAIGRLVYIAQSRHKAIDRLELFFNVANVADYQDQQLKKRLRNSQQLDEIGFVNPKGNTDLRPVFLQREPVVLATKQKHQPVKLITAEI